MKTRLLSIDVMRGMTIAFMIIVNTPGSWSYVYPPLLHAKWHGVTPTDLVFPFFIFIMGVSMAFSFSNIDNINRTQFLKKVLKRTFLIFLVGFLLNWFPFYNEHITEVRVFGVLQRIALSYGLAGILIIYARSLKSQIAAVLIGLIGYHFLQMYFGDFTLEGSVNRKINDFLLPADNLYGGFGIPFDPEGIVGTISSGMHVIIGYIVGNHLKKLKDTPINFIKQIIPIGLILIFAAWLYCHIIPINKPLWTGSYVLNTSGKACLLLALLVYIIDVTKVNKWSFPFQVFGKNALISYVFSSVVSMTLYQILKNENGSAYEYLYAQIYQPTFGAYLGSFLFALSVCLFVFGFAYVLFKRKIFIKI
ncbi:MAG: putative acyltransferase [Saprospiraceae bacterium]|jgi:predicted acyltransferase